MIKKIIYDKTTGEILVKTETYQFIENLFVNESQEFKNNLGEIEINNPPNNIRLYKVVDGELIEKEREPIEPEHNPTPTNKELQKEINELKQVIDILIGGAEDGI